MTGSTVPRRYQGRPIAFGRERVGRPHVEAAVGGVEVVLERGLRWKSDDSGGDVRIDLLPSLVHRRHVVGRQRADELSVVAVRQPRSRRRVPQIERVGLRHVAPTVQVWHEASHERVEVPGGDRKPQLGRQSLAFDGRRAIEAFEVVRAAAVRVVPPERLVDVVRGKGGRRPVVTVGACLGIDEESIEEAEPKRQRAVIGRDVLRWTAASTRGVARRRKSRAKDRRRPACRPPMPRGRRTPDRRSCFP